MLPYWKIRTGDTDSVIPKTLKELWVSIWPGNDMLALVRTEEADRPILIGRYSFGDIPSLNSYLLVDRSRISSK
jgi:hypothetical protein